MTIMTTRRATEEMNPVALLPSPLRESVAVAVASVALRQADWTVERIGAADGPTREAAISVDITCEHRTGVLGIQAVTPAAFESAVVFKRPRWRELRTEHSLMKEALRQLESGAEKPAVFENGTRVAWYLERPKIGERYIFVAFHEGGVKLWKQRLAATTFGAKLRRLIRLEAR